MSDTVVTLHPRRRRSRAFLRSAVGPARASGSSSPSSQASTRAAAKGDDRKCRAGPCFSALPRPARQRRQGRRESVVQSAHILRLNVTVHSYKPARTCVQKHCSSPAAVVFHCSSRCSSCTAPAGPAGSVELEGVGPLLSMPVLIFPVKVKHGLPPLWGGQSILEIPSRSSKSKQQQQSFQPLASLQCPPCHPTSCQGG